VTRTVSDKRVNEQQETKMNDDMYVVIVDTRGMSPAQIDGYEEHACTQKFFNDHILSHPRVRCIKSKVAELCGMKLKIYFYEYAAEKSRHHALADPPEVAISNEEREDIYPANVVNGGATLLTSDPLTGFPEYQILGKAYAVVDSGDYPLSNHQVWGFQELISEARDFYYYCDPDHQEMGRRKLLTWCLEYRDQEYGPLTIYEPRTGDHYYTDEDDYYRHRHFGRDGRTVPTSHVVAASRSQEEEDGNYRYRLGKFTKSHNPETPGRKQIYNRTKKGRQPFSTWFMFGRDHGYTTE
jgi:hypothetical protein